MTTSGGGTAPSTTCFWAFYLDDGRRLAWSSPGQNGPPAQRTTHLRQHGPVKVRFWRGTVYQVELAQGQIYLDRADVARSEGFWQWVRVLEGLLVAAASVSRIGLELRRPEVPPVDQGYECRACLLTIVCLLGAGLQGATRADLRWSGVIWLALFAAGAPEVSRAIMRRTFRTGASPATSSA